MPKEIVDQNPTVKDLMVPLVDPEQVDSIQLDQLRSLNQETTSQLGFTVNPAEIPALADKMLRQSLFLRRLNGLPKTTFEESRKSPWKHKCIQIKLDKKYRPPEPANFQPEPVYFIAVSRITDPPPPVHDLGDFDVEDLEILSRNPEVMESFAEDQSKVPQDQLVSDEIDDNLIPRTTTDPEEETSIIHYVEIPDPEE